MMALYILTGLINECRVLVCSVMRVNKHDVRQKKKRKEMDALRSLSCGFLISVCDTSGPLEVSFCIPEQETDNLVDCSTIYTLIKCSIFPVFGKNAA